MKGARGGQEDPAVYRAPIGQHLVKMRHSDYTQYLVFRKIGISNHICSSGTHLPHSLVLPPGGRHHPGAELDVGIKVVFPREGLQVLLDLLGGGHKPGPVRVREEGELVERGPHVTRAPRVGVMMPGATNIAALNEELTKSQNIDILTCFENCEGNSRL